LGKHILGLLLLLLLLGVATKEAPLAREVEEVHLHEIGSLLLLLRVAPKE
jgi:hypothetical protein